MAPSWLDQLERNLEERLNAFLRSNPQQDQLLRQQHLHDRQQDLQRRRRQLQEQERSIAVSFSAWRGKCATGADAVIELARPAQWIWHDGPKPIRRP